MDTTDSSDSLQKTSPQSDPAAVSSLAAAYTAQAGQLEAHHRQLSRLTALTEELVKAVQTLQNPAPERAPPQPDRHQPAEATPTASPRLALPEKFDGNPSRCKGFILQCSLFIAQQPTLYTTEAGKIAFVCSLLTGRALDWITAVWRSDGSAFLTFEIFLQRFREVFEHSREGKSAGDRLLELSQGKLTAAEYALNFRTLAAQTTWVNDTLKAIFRRGLTHELQSELACRDEGRDLDEFINLAIQIDNLVRSRRASHRSVSAPRHIPSPRASETLPVDATEPMQVNAYHLSEEERERRITHHLCMYCGEAGHLRLTCPSRPRPAASRPVSLISDWTL
jgi:hypothetical protein